jgi:predicted hydrolase (HD superfamily)
MLPSNDVMDIKPSSISKKLKDLSFAAGVDRKEVQNCETLLSIPMAEFIEDVKLALRGGNWTK